MKILIVGPWQAPIIKRLATSFSERGDAVLVATHDLDNYEGLPSRIEFFNLGRLKSFSDFFHFWKINRLVKEYKPDVLHAHVVNHYGLMSAFTSVPLVVALWGSDVLIDPYKGGRLRTTIIRCINWLVFRRASLLHTSSPSVANKIRSYSKSISEKTNVFYWGLPLEVESQNGKFDADMALSSQFGIEGRGFYVFPRGLSEVYRPDLVSALIRRLSKLGVGKKIVVLKAFSSDMDEKKFLESLEGVQFIYVNRLLNDIELSSLYSRSNYHFSLPKSDSLGGGVVEPYQFGSMPVLSNIPSYEKFAKESSALVIENESERELDVLARNLVYAPRKHKAKPESVYTKESVIFQVRDLYIRAR